MDDPWGSPWAADPSPPKIDLPTAPPDAHFAVESQTRGPRSASISPWGKDDDEDDAWGGWADPASGKASPGWGRSPGLKPLSGRTTRQASPDPWGTMGPLETRRDKEPERVLDSAISLGDDPPGHSSVDLRSLAEPNENIHDIWTENDSATAAVTDPISIDVPGRPDSPDITSGKALGAEQRPEMVRQASKVQELVEMYDGIAKQGTPPLESPSTVTKELGVLEEMSEKAPEEPTAESKATETAVDKEALSSKAQRQQDDDSGLSPEIDHAKGYDETAVHEETGPRPPKLPPSLSYHVDLSKLDELFPSTPESSCDPEPIPDVIIDDTFASISERKAWYRMSRFGSMRKHNLGDDENYVRISWAGSEVRDGTLRIVRRWMEEDSIAGRVVLGRRTGAVGASMFGWDSEAPQVDVGELLGRKGRHSRHVSQVSKASTVSPTTVAAFGWSSSLPSSPTAADATSRPSAEGKANGHVVTPANSQGASKNRSLVQPPERPQSLNQALVGPTISTTLPPDNQAAPDDDDDDDWGEMVTSPTLPASNTATMTAPFKTAVNKTETSDSFLDSRPSGSEPNGREQLSSQPDPWASANLDFLARGSTPKFAPTQTLQLPPTKATHTPGDQAIDISRATTTSPPLKRPPPARTSTNRTTTQEHGDAHEDEIVTNILRDLPDLSYMFR